MKIECTCLKHKWDPNCPKHGKTYSWTYTGPVPKVTLGKEE